MTYPYPQLTSPTVRFSTKLNAPDIKVYEWIQTLPENVHDVDWSKIDVTILGVPLSRSSISASAASETPDELRKTWKFFNTYNVDYDVDLRDLHVVDLGDVRQHVTNIAICHENITEAMIAARTHHPNTIPIMIGGDHSITAQLVKGWKQVHRSETIGILQFDTHFDLRDLKEFGPTNGTPIRHLIESEIVKGKHIYNIGLHGFFNAKSLKTYADKVQLNYVTMREVRKKGITTIVSNALSNLSEQVDTIYLTVDMDVLDIGIAPGAPASTPGGMRTDELFEAVTIAGQCPKVKAMDIVCLDPTKDVRGATVKAGVHVMLSFLTGILLRKTHNFKA